MIITDPGPPDLVGSGSKPMTKKLCQEPFLKSLYSKLLTINAVKKVASISFDAF
jgi:hypothetical protein